MQLNYIPPGKVAKTFMKDTAFVRGLRGPVGSGKSVTCCMEIMRKAVAQKPNSANIRKSRWAVIRNTNPQLKTTTIKTWRDWFSDDLGKFVWSPPYTHHVCISLGDKTTVELGITETDSKNDKMQEKKFVTQSWKWGKKKCQEG